MKTKRKADFQRAGSILLSGKAPALQTEDPDEDLHVDKSAGDTAMDVQDDEVVVGILQCAQCRTNRHVSTDMLSFYSDRPGVFKCDCVSESCRKLRRRKVS